MIIYLTYNDLPSGIFASQVIDVVKYLNSELNTKTRLVSFISLRNFLVNRKKIKGELADAIVIPMFPGVHNWRKNAFLLRLINFIYKPDKIIGRSVMATQLALDLKKRKLLSKVVYDGRGAISAEWKEYNVVDSNSLKNEIYELEKQAILNADFRIAVSNQLIKYWKKEFNYESLKHVVIPCTLNKAFETIEITNEAVITARELIGFSKSDIILAYSGSIAGWQSFELLYGFIKPILISNEDVKLLFLSERDENIVKLEAEFPEKIVCKKVKPIEVPHYLIAADYGLLIREQSITNLVASPVKFAEYLACGLKVIISEQLGDYTSFVNEHKCVGGGVEINFFEKTSLSDKLEIKRIALNHFSKRSLNDLYIVFLNNC